MEGPKNRPIRVLVAVSSKSPHWSTAWTSSEVVINLALELVIKHQLITCDINTPYQLLATERWNRRTFLVFDLFHDLYDPDSAHLPGQNILPVISVSLYEKKEVANLAGTPMSNQVNRDLQKLHNSTGIGSRPPFVVDHANGNVPTYRRPRNVIDSSHLPIN